jgi:hypothetical protein
VQQLVKQYQQIGKINALLTPRATPMKRWCKAIVKQYPRAGVSIDGSTDPLHHTRQYLGDPIDYSRHWTGVVQVENICSPVTLSEK